MPKMDNKPGKPAGKLDFVLVLLYVLAAAALVGSVLMVNWAFGGVPLDILLRPWYLSRGSGFIAYLLMWASVVVGLLQSMGLLRRLTKPVANVDIHDFVSMAAVYATLFHGLILVFDRPKYAFSLPEVLVPFETARQPLLMAFGILGLYLAIAASLTTYLRGKMNATVWRAIHLASLAGFAMAWFHGLLLGSESDYLVVWAMYLVTGLIVLLLTLLRIIRAVTQPKRKGRPAH